MKFDFTVRNVTGKQLIALLICLAAIPVVYKYGGDHFLTAVVGQLATIVMSFMKRIGDPPDAPKRLPYDTSETHLTVVSGEKKK